jgi:putative flavoprotein involved in K+ transport
MHTERIETVIIGGGQAGLAMSYHLRQHGHEHLVLERARIAERWRSERWDSLRFQSPNWNMHLPGLALQAADPDAFSPRDDVVQFIERYATFAHAPVRCGVEATALRERPGSRRLVVETATGLIEAKNVVLATGPFQKPLAPPFCTGRDLEIHASQYRNPQQLPQGAVLVVGSGNSGCQIAEELNSAGRQVYLSVGRHRQVPRRYRGRDYFWWYLALGDADTTVDQRAAARPSILVTGVNGGHDVDLRKLSANGIILLGHVIGHERGRVSIADDLARTMSEGEDAKTAFQQRADAYADRNRNTVSAAYDPPSAVHRPIEVDKPILYLDLFRSGISTLIWANGYGYDYDWVDLPIFGERPAAKSAPVHRRGVTKLAGAYVLGLPWLFKLKSSFLHGVGEDAEFLAEHIMRNDSPDR